MWSPVAAADPPTREQAVRALLDRSRLLEDIRFTIPVSVYQDYLRDTAGGDGPAAPVAFIAAAGRYGLTLDAGRKPILTARISLRIFDPRARRDVPILTAALAWDKVMVTGKPAKLPLRDGWLRFTPAAAGTYEITAEVALKPPDADGGRVALDIPQTLQTLLAFDAPQAWQVAAEGVTATIRGEAAAGTHGILAFAPRGRLELSYTPAVALPPRPPRFELGGAIAWNLDAGRQQVAARIAVRFLGGKAERLDLALPAGAAQVSITGPDVREAQVAGGSAAVFLRGPVEGQTRLDVQYELPAGAAGIIPLERIELRDGHWAGGVLVVTNTAGGSEVLAHEASGLRELHPSDLPEEARAILAGQPVLAYRIAARDFAVSVDAIQLGELALRESIADLAHYQAMLRPDGSILCKADYEIRNRTRQFLRLDLPAGAVVLSARVNDKAQPLTPLPGQRDAYILPLVRSTASVKGLVSFPVQVVLMCRTAGLTGRGELAVPLPRIDLPIAYGWCELHVPQGTRIRRWAGPLAQVDRYSSETAVASLDYGRGELAEGYKAEDRPTVEGRPPPPKPDKDKPKPKPKPPPLKPPPLLGLLLGAGMAPQAKEAPPQAMPELPATTLLRTGTARFSADEPVAAPPPATRPAAPGEAEKTAGLPVLTKRPAFSTTFGAAKLAVPTLESLETTVTVPDGGTLALGGQLTSSSGVLLGRNYYRAGRDYYEKGRLEEAEQSLRKAVELAPKSADAPNAERLLANIRTLQGKSATTSRQEKALAKQVQQETSAANIELQQRQRELLEQGKEATRQGQAAQARVQLEAAESLGRQLVAQGADEKEQDVVLRDARQQLQHLREQDKARAGELKERFARYKASGDYQAAIQTGKALQTLDDSSSIRQELEALVVHSVRAQAQPAQQRAAPAQPPGVQVARQTSVGDLTHIPAAPAQPSIELHGGTLVARGRLTIPAPTPPDQPPAYGRAGPGGAPQQVTVFTLTNTKPTELADALKHAFSPARGARASGGPAQPPVIVADPQSNRLIVSASDADVEKIKSLLTQLDTNARSSPRTEMFVLRNARAQDTAQALNQMFGSKASGARGRAPRPQDEDDRPTIRADTTSNAIVVSAPGQRLEEITKVLVELDAAAAQGAAELKQPGTAGRRGERPADETEVPLVVTSGARIIQPDRGNTGRTSAESLDTPLVMTDGGQVSVVRAPAGQGVVSKAYDVRDLLATGPSQDEARGDGRKLADDLVKSVKGSVAADAWDVNGDFGIQVANGRLVVTQTEENQRAVADLVEKLRGVRGPQVEVGSNIAQQRAGAPAQVQNNVDGTFLNTVSADFQLAMEDATRGDARAGDNLSKLAHRPEFQDFLKRNYDWRLTGRDGGFAYGISGREPGSAVKKLGDGALAVDWTDKDGDGQADFYMDLSGKLMRNLGQKVVVSSTNIGLPAIAARGLGVGFLQGSNSVNYAVVDEAQLRTLRELETSQTAESAGVPANTRWQETIIGTDALLASGQTANLAYAADAANTLEVSGNTIALPHEKYILIDNAGYLTAVKAGAMQHWMAAPQVVQFAEVPQDIAVPPVGQLVKFEKTLIRPTDELTIRASYSYEGAAR